jgi:hypothetical protein
VSRVWRPEGCAHTLTTATSTELKSARVVAARPRRADGPWRAATATAVSEDDLKDVLVLASPAAGSGLVSRQNGPKGVPQATERCSYPLGGVRWVGKQ